MEDLELTVGCRATGIDVLFPNGAVVTVSDGTVGRQTSDHHIMMVGLVNEGVVATLQTEDGITYWGTVPGIRRVQYGFGLPTELQTW